MNFISPAVRPSRADWLAMAAIALLPVICFWRAVFFRGVFHVHDVQFYYFPYHALSAQLLDRGEWPLWNAGAFSGFPLIGDAQTAVFFPPNWLFFVLPPDVAFGHVVVLQYIIAGLGMFAFLRDVKLVRPAALLGAFVYMLAGFLSARVVHLSILGAAAMVPTIALCVRRALGDGSRRWFALAAVAVALQVFTGHPQLPIYTGLTLLFLSLVMARGRAGADSDRSWFWRLPLRLFLIYALGYSLAAVQIVPMLELTALSPRAAGASYNFVFASSATPYDWLMMLFPYAFGSLRTGLFADEPLAPEMGSRIWEHSAYVGILPLALAAFAVWQIVLARRKQAATANEPMATLTPYQRQLAFFFAGLVAFAFVFASGRYTPLSHLTYLTPIIGKLRAVARFLVFADFALAALAAFGCHLLLTRAGKETALEPALARRLRTIAAVAFALPITIAALLQLPFINAKLRPELVTHLAPTRANLLVPIALGIACAAVMRWLARRPLTCRGSLALCGLVAVDLGLYAANFNPITSPDFYRKPPDSLQAFKNESAPFRKLTFLRTNHVDDAVAKESLVPSWSLLFGIDDINGFSSLQPRRYTDYLFGPATEDVSYGQFSRRELLRDESPILSSLNVKYLMVPRLLRPRLGSRWRPVFENEEVRVLANPDVYPRAFFADSARIERDPATILATVTADGFDGRQLALVEPTGELTLPTSSPTPAPTAAVGQTPRPSIALGPWRSNELRLTAETAQPRLLVLSEMFFPGWRAFIDGQATPIHRANYLFRSVVVPAGRHEVVFRYRPTSVLGGGAVTILGLVVVAALLGWGRRRRA